MATYLTLTLVLNALKTQIAVQSATAQLIICTDEATVLILYKISNNSLIMLSKITMKTMMSKRTLREDSSRLDTGVSRTMTVLLRNVLKLARENTTRNAKRKTM